MSVATDDVAGQWESIHLHIFRVDGSTRCTRTVQVRCGDEGGKHKGDGGEEAKDALDPVQGVVHDARWWRTPRWRCAEDLNSFAGLSNPHRKPGIGV